MEVCDNGVRRVLQALRTLYGRVQTLEEFSNGVEFRDGQKPLLLEERDSVRLRALLRGMVLATLPEVLAFVLNRMKMKKKRNVLSFGYRFSTARGDSDPFKFHGSISQSAAFICGSEAWAKINQRLGTDLTQYLLTHCAVFTTAPPTCLVQICGVPVYDLVPVHSWSGFLLNSDQRNKAGTMNRNQRITFKHQTRVRKNSVNRRNAKNIQNTVNNKKRKREEETEVKDVMEGHEERPAKQNNTKILNPDSDLGKPCVDKNVCSVQSALPHISPSSRHGLSSWKASDQPPPRPSHCFISVLSMLYGGRGMNAFLLNRKLQGHGGGIKMIHGADVVKMVFCLKDKEKLSGSKSQNHKLPKRFFAMVPIFDVLIRRHRMCRYIRFLSRKCATSESDGDMASLLSSHCSPYRVYLFVRECVRFVIPDELWGSQHNMVQFLSRVKHFLKLGKFEKLSLAQVMWKIRVSDCRWLGNKKRPCPSEHRYREWIFGQFLLWLLKDFVIGLVKSLFYVTESVGHKHALRFYRHHIWNRLQNQAFREHLSKGQWKELSPAEASSLPKNTGTSRIRFIPKTNGMRPITCLISTAAAVQFQSSVRDLQNVLSVCVRERPALLGSTVWGRQDIHKVLRSIPHSHSPFYFVKVDISGAYDSLPHSKLLEVVQDVLKPVEDTCFSLRHYAKVCTDSDQEIRKHFCTRAEAFELLNMKGFVVEEQNNGNLHDAILVEKLLVEVKGADVFQFFKQMLSSYIIQYNKKLFRQVCGVPQGSAVSTMLCNLCYGHMENCVLEKVTEKGGYLMRLVDDFLLITPRLSKAEEFLKTLMAGVPEYGCVINPQKLAVNFPLSEDLQCVDATEFPAHCMFPWCGLLIDTRSLHVYNDYSGYILPLSICLSHYLSLIDTRSLHVYNDYSGYAGQSLRYSLTLGSTHTPAMFMRRKLLMILRLKCDRILLDVRLNSIDAVYRNIYKLLLLQAMRFHVCVRSLPLGQGVWTNPIFFVKMIWSMVKITTKNITHSNPGMCVDEVLQDEAVTLLCCLAFDVVLTHHRSSYLHLLPHIHKRRRSVLSTLRGIRLARVLQAATPRIPCDFTSIRI
ncbi:telomerase reverse transcriptase isoform X2 [Silurus meridionalis]|uniref:telomerase reverse transcriptase isoform X2 n=1 Tax=Silurus meridionalis TaxID=175797 RepID=UPI001EEA2D05|nr:telomerase reverse transcriptase isoform X2 [Silurus meridionalis]